MWAVSGVVPNKTHHRNRVQVITFFFFLLSYRPRFQYYTQKAHYQNFFKSERASQFKLVSFDNGALQSYYFLMDSHSLYLSLHPSTLLCVYPYLHFFVFFIIHCTLLVITYYLLIQCLLYLFFWWLRCVRLRDSRFGVVLINPRR